MREKVKQDILVERTKSYNNIYNILTDNLQRAKDRLSKIAEIPMNEDDEAVSVNF